MATPSNKSRNVCLPRNIIAATAAKCVLVMAFNTCLWRGLEIVLYETMWRKRMYHSNISFPFKHMHSLEFFLLSTLLYSNYLLGSAPKTPQAPTISNVRALKLIPNKIISRNVFFKRNEEEKVKFGSILTITSHIVFLFTSHYPYTCPGNILMIQQHSFFLTGSRNNHNFFKVSRVPRIESLLFL